MAESLFKNIVDASVKSFSPPPVEPSESKRPTPVKYVPPEKVKNLLSWEAPSRIFVKRDKQWFTTVGIVLGVVMIIMTLLGQFLLVVALGALGFMGYALSVVRPGRLQNRITNQGVLTGDFSLPWGELTKFWFDKKHNKQILQIATEKKFPGQISLILEGENVTKDKLVDLISPFLFYQESPPVTWLTRFESFISSKLDLS